MKTSRVYVDNSVIGGCFDDEFARWSNALMEDFQKRVFLPVISVVIEREAKLQGTPQHVADKYDWLVEQGAEVLQLNE